MSAKIGRNDPCHCGSGKKYKHCHLNLDAVTRPLATTGELEETPRNPTSPFELEMAVRTLQEMQNKGDKKQQKEIAQLLARTEPARIYLSRKLEIDAATQALRPHQQEFINFVKNNIEYQDRVEALFADARFAPLRFTPARLQRAFDRLGSLPAVPKEKMAAHIHSLILYLADNEYRTAASVSLLVSLPDYVTAGRHIDGCLVLSCARMTSEDSKSANPFLWQMFVHGYQAWTAAQQARLST